MSNVHMIQAKVDEFVTKQEAFTSLDISNAIKKDGTWVRNRDVARYLRKNFNVSGYQKTVIAVEGNRSATLYHPDFMDADNYDNRQQQAMTSTEFNTMHPGKSVSDNADDNATGSQNAQTTTPTASLATPSNGKHISISSNRIRISASIVKTLGLNPGDAIDASRIQSSSAIPSRLRVHKDGRLSLPSKCFPLSGKVSMTIQNNQLVLS